MDVDVLAFTGSTATGAKLLEHAGRSNLKRVWLECGGKSPHLVFADAPDLDVAAKAVAQGIFFNQGEVCTAGSRLLVQRSIREDFVHQVIAYGQHMQPQHPLEADAPMGALVDAAHVDKVLADIARAEGEGARLLLGGHRAEVEAGGCYVQPTVFDQCVRTTRWHARRCSARCWRCLVSRMKRRQCAWPMTAAMGWRRACGHATSAAPIASHASCAPAACG